MYPKNAASPEPIAIGPVVQISDGAVQTSGCTVRVKPIGVAEADGGGTTAYSTDGVVFYTPTQAETNYTSFVLIAKKTGCIPASITVITTASATPGTVLLAPVTHTSAVIPTVSTLTGHTAQTGDSFAIVSNGTHGNAALKTLIDTVDDLLDTEIAAIKSKTDNLPADPADASDIAASFASLASTLSTIASYIDTEVAAIKAKTDNLPTDPADQSAVEAAITAATAGLATAASLATVAGYLDTEIAAILADTNELQTDWTNGGRLDLILDEILTDTGTTLQGELDGIQTDTEDIQTRLPAALVSGRIDASVGAMAANTLTASALAADAVTEIQSGLSTLTAANVNAEVLDVLQTDTFAELGAVPAATSSLKDKLTWLFMWFRNKSTETATQRKLYADDTTTVVSTETVSDDGTTFSKGEAS